MRRNQAADNKRPELDTTLRPVRFPGVIGVASTVDVVLNPAVAVTVNSLPYWASSTGRIHGYAGVRPRPVSVARARKAIDDSNSAACNVIIEAAVAHPLMRIDALANRGPSVAQPDSRRCRRFSCRCLGGIHLSLSADQRRFTIRPSMRSERPVNHATPPASWTCTCRRPAIYPTGRHRLPLILIACNALSLQACRGASRCCRQRPGQQISWRVNRHRDDTTKPQHQ